MQWCPSNHPVSYRKCLGTCDAFLCVSHTLHSALESGQEARILHIDFSSAFDRVNHLGIFYKLCSVGIGGSCPLTGGVFKCDIAHRRSVAVLCMLYKMRCNQMHPGVTLLMVLYLDRMCLCGLHAVLWLHIGILIRCLAAKPRSTAWLLFLAQCSSGTILLSPYSMMWDWRVSRAGPMLFYWPYLLYRYYSLCYFPFLFFLSISCYCGAGVFGLIGCISLSLSIAMPTSFNNNNNNITKQVHTYMCDSKKNNRLTLMPIVWPLGYIDGSGFKY